MAGPRSTTGYPYAWVVLRGNQVETDVFSIAGPGLIQSFSLAYSNSAQASYGFTGEQSTVGTYGFIDESSPPSNVTAPINTSLPVGLNVLLRIQQVTGVFAPTNTTQNTTFEFATGTEFGQVTYSPLSSVNTWYIISLNYTLLMGSQYSTRLRVQAAMIPYGPVLSSTPIAIQIAVSVAPLFAVRIPG